MDTNKEDDQCISEEQLRALDENLEGIKAVTRSFLPKENNSVEEVTEYEEEEE